MKVNIGDCVEVDVEFIQGANLVGVIVGNLTDYLYLIRIMNGDISECTAVYKWEIIRKLNVKEKALLVL